MGAGTLERSSPYQKELSLPAWMRKRGLFPVDQVRACSWEVGGEHKERGNC